MLYLKGIVFVAILKHNFENVIFIEKIESFLKDHSKDINK